MPRRSTALGPHEEMLARLQQIRNDAAGECTDTGRCYSPSKVTYPAFLNSSRKSAMMLSGSRQRTS